jgi:hypothetical protein
MGQTKAEKLAEKAAAREALVSRWKDEILKPSTLLEFRTEYGKGETDYVEAHCYYLGKDGKLQHFPLTVLIAQAWGMKLKRTQSKTQIAEGGGGLSKSYKIAMMLFQVLDIEHRETDINFTYR